MSKDKIVHVAIVGRPNVGKSTLFNRFINKRKSITDDRAGTTRDRLYERTTFNDKEVFIIDTGGIQYADSDDFDSLVDTEVNKALVEADLVLFVLDVDDVTALDYQLADDIRRRGKDVILVINKVDNHKTKENINDYYQLGFGEPVLISAMHGNNVDELEDVIYDRLPKVCALPNINYKFKLAFFGEPNAGKSTLLNRMLGKERSVVSDMPGTTRDFVEEIFECKDENIMLVDTAGLRKTKKMKNSADVFSIFRTKKIVDEADVLLLLVDAVKGPCRDTRNIYRLVVESNKAVLLVINKWDLVEGVQMNTYKKELLAECPFMANVPMFFMSAKTGRNVNKLMNVAFDLWAKFTASIPTSELNKFLEHIKKVSPPPGPVRFKYIVQIGMAPPKFLVFVKNKKFLKKNYISFIESNLVKAFDLKGVKPIVKFKEEEKES